MRLHKAVAHLRIVEERIVTLMALAHNSCFLF